MIEPLCHLSSQIIYVLQKFYENDFMTSVRSSAGLPLPASGATGMGRPWSGSTDVAQPTGQKAVAQAARVGESAGRKSTGSIASPASRPVASAHPSPSASSR